MIDNFALGLTHALLALAAWRLIQRNDLDSEPAKAAVAAAVATPVANTGQDDRRA